MQKVFDEVRTLDKRCGEAFHLSQEILMENAASSIMQYIKNKFFNKKKILVVCGAYNNGADGLVLSRLLYDTYEVSVYMPFGVKSKMAQLQYKRIEQLKVPIIDDLADNYRADIIVDCLFGSGLNRDLDNRAQGIISLLNAVDAYKIACDIPSGINAQGHITTECFKADTTITMGALKTQLYLDGVKDYVGEIIVGNLGLPRREYESIHANKYLLDESDMILPFRKSKNAHKGNYGHLNVIVGDKIGASLLAGEAAFSFGVGLVTAVCSKSISLPVYMMKGNSISKNCTSIAIGMGLGAYEVQKIKEILDNDIAKVIDADLFYDEVILTTLDKKNVVLTPHPKEFCALLKLTRIADITIEELQNSRFEYLSIFGQEYPNVTLLLKGANSLIIHENKIYINTLGNTLLSKGGSGDVLTGLIASLLAQGFSSLNACLTASLAHSISAQNYDKNSYSFMPSDLIEGIKVL